MLRIRRRGQSTLEFSLIIVIVMAVLMSMSIYFKRGIQGKWKESIDSLGEQYDPFAANAVIQHNLTQSTYTVLDVKSKGGNTYTSRKDETNTTESTVGGRRLDTYF